MNPHAQASADQAIPADAHVEVNLGSLTQSARGAVSGVIFVDTGAAQFPERQWNDFVVVVLGWWCAACTSLLGGASEVELWFMDGPFLLQLEVATVDMWTARFLRMHSTESLDVVTRPVLGLADGLRIRPATFVGSVVTASRAVLAECARRGWTTPDIDELNRKRGVLESLL